MRSAPRAPLCSLPMLLLLSCVSGLGACSDASPAGADAAPADARADSPAADAAPDSPAADAGADGLGDAADPCAPAAPTPTRPRFATLRAAVAAAADAAARQSLVDAFLAGLGDDYPLRDEKGAVVLATQPGVAIAGSFNNWTPAAMTQLSDTTLRYAELDVGPGEATYKLVDGSDWQRDPRDRHVRWDGIPRAGVGLFNSVIPPFDLAAATTSRLEVLRVQSPELSNTRDVFVYLPAGYDAERCTKRPLLLVNDGNESLTRSHFDAVADATIAAQRARSLVMAFVALADQADRNDEYGTVSTSSGPKYVTFLCDTLIPALETRYRLVADRASRGVIGASLGGLSALGALVARDDCFARAGAQSGSFWYENEALITRAQSGPLLRVDAVYLDNGTDNRDSTLKMRDVLVGRGYPVVHRENLAQDHTWDAWADRFDDALEALFGAGSSP